MSKLLPEPLAVHLENRPGHLPRRIDVLDEPGPGGAHHVYQIRTIQEGGEATGLASFKFQEGPIKEAGHNGVHHEDMLRVVAHRLECFQKGQYACDENAEALSHVRAALECMDERTSRRLARGVEGTSKV